MKKMMLDFYKPNGRGEGAALQVTRTNKGLNIQLAKQMTMGNRRQGQNATFDWNEQSFSATLKIDELAKISAYLEKAKQEKAVASQSTKINKMVQGETANKIPIDIVALEPVRFPHLNSTTPKTIKFSIKEFPVGSGNLTLELNVSGSMGFYNKLGKFEIKENQNISIYLTEDEFTNLKLVVESQIQNQLEDNLISSCIVNRSEQDAKGIGGFKTIKEIRLPNLSVGEDITGVRKDLRLRVISKEFDATQGKPIYYCETIY